MYHGDPSKQVQPLEKAAKVQTKSRSGFTATSRSWNPRQLSPKELQCHLQRDFVSKHEQLWLLRFLLFLKCMLLLIVLCANQKGSTKNQPTENGLIVPLGALRHKG